MVNNLDGLHCWNSTFRRIHYCVVVQRLSKMFPFMPLKGPGFLSKNLWDYMESPVFEWGIQFTPSFWMFFCKTLKIELSLSLDYHLQTNGQIERTNRTLKQHVRYFSTFVHTDRAFLLWITVSILCFCPWTSRIHQSQHSMTSCNFFSLRTGFFLDRLSSKTFFDKIRRREQFCNLVISLKLAWPFKNLGTKFIGCFPVKMKINTVSFLISLRFTQCFPLAF